MILTTIIVVVRYSKICIRLKCSTYLTYKSSMLNIFLLIHMLQVYELSIIYTVFNLYVANT
jgi:hypothetical protein